MMKKIIEKVEYPNMSFLSYILYDDKELCVLIEYTRIMFELGIKDFNGVTDELLIKRLVLNLIK